VMAAALTLLAVLHFSAGDTAAGAGWATAGVVFLVDRVAHRYIYRAGFMRGYVAALADAHQATVHGDLQVVTRRTARMPEPWDPEEPEHGGAR
jgi:uncharacterized protein (DUF1800 family)